MTITAARTAVTETLPTPCSANRPATLVTSSSVFAIAAVPLAVLIACTQDGTSWLIT